jgi:hypothetical protein
MSLDVLSWVILGFYTNTSEAMLWKADNCAICIQIISQKQNSNDRHGLTAIVPIQESVISQEDL